MQQLKISVIICSYNRQDYIIQALDSLYHQGLPKSLYEVIVVDNNSSDNTAQICRDYIAGHPDYNIRYLTETRQGASFARNTGATASVAALLAFMDDDAIAQPDFLERIIRFFESHQDATGMGGRIIPRYIPEEPKWMSHFVASLVGNFDYSPQVVPFKAGKYPLESNMVVRKKAFDQIGGFNTDLPGVAGTLRIGGEGKDFFLKLQSGGGKIYYDPSVVVEHVVETNKLTREYMYRVASGIGRGERVRMLARGGFAYFNKVLEYLFKLGASLVLSAIYVLQGNPAKAMPVIRFRIDALKGLFNR
jgi:glycosyltransferase involved in cell wall biosynthesis